MCLRIFVFTKCFVVMHRRILKNRPPPEEPEIDLYKLPLMKSTSVQRQSIHSINGAIGKDLIGLVCNGFRLTHQDLTGAPNKLFHQISVRNAHITLRFWITIRSKVKVLKPELDLLRTKYL